MSKQEADGKLVSCWLLAWLTLRPWRWRQLVSQNSELIPDYTTWYHILPSHCCQNLKSNIFKLSSCDVFFLYLYSCCSRLEHRASVKRFVSLQFLNFRQSVGFLGRVISPSQSRYLHTEQHKTQNKRRRTSMPCIGLETTIPVFERMQIFHALDRAATVIGMWRFTCMEIYIKTEKTNARNSSVIPCQRALVHSRYISYKSLNHGLIIVTLLSEVQWYECNVFQRCDF
jgi:hypothetical protein